MPHMLYRSAAYTSPTRTNPVPDVWIGMMLTTRSPARAADLADLLLAVEEHRAVAEPVAELPQRHPDERPAREGGDDAPAAVLQPSSA